ncbi:hypothetical protein FMUND_621 [Fusarium mundagurra]|uniref:Uncharacterized protein n=1 Tax=Fusarium mundagurra TaxID=1567541 RepID=A0A8H5Z7E1_9HYPO|nr:hypothetical protein FMUND_621 [Fusarium mundagurra]
MECTQATNCCNTHHISRDDVLCAPRLAKRGEQRLRAIVHGEPNNFSFYIPFDDQRWASVEFHIEPIVSDLAQHTLYAVTGSFTPSHDSIHSSQVLSAAQLIYDTYIRVTSLRLDEDLFKRQAPSTPNSAFHPSTLSAPGHEEHVANTPGSFDAVAHLSTDAIPSTERILHDSQSYLQSISIRPLNSATRNAESGLREPICESTTDQKQQKRDQVVKNLVNAVLHGQKKIDKDLKKWNKTQLEAIKYHSIVPQSLPADADSQSFHEYLDQVEEALLNHMRVEKHDLKKRNWMTWFYLSCLRLVREKIDKGLKHGSATAAKIINDIVDRLLITDGVQAVGVYDGLSERSYKLSTAYHATQFDAEYIAEQAAKQLRGRVAAPPNSFQVPFPGFWLHTVTKVPGVLLPEPSTSCSDEGIGQSNNVVDTLATNTNTGFTQDCLSNFDDVVCTSSSLDLEDMLAFPT